MVLSRVLCSALLIFVPLVGHAGALTVTVLDPKGEPLADAVVAVLTDQPQNASAEAPEAIMDQRDRQFIPQVLAVRTDTLVRFPNSDNIRHHVYSFSPAKRFELRLYHGTTAEPVRFDQPGKVALGCNIHDAMLGYIYVVDTPWFGVSGSDGQVQFDELPAGRYQVELQHPRLAEPVTRSLELEGESSPSLQVTLEPLQPDPRQRQSESELDRLFD